MLARLNELLLAAMSAQDPGAFLRQAAADTDLDDEERTLLRSADPDGLLLTRRLVQKLRFERLLRGEPGLQDACDADPEAFAAEFQRYDAEVPVSCFYPADEAAAWRAWRQR